MIFSEETAQMIFYGLLFLMSVMSCYSFVLMARDKKLAQKREWRISEAHLLLSAFLMGGMGAWLGMKVFRHKTKHLKFQLLVPMFAILQMILLVWVNIRLTSR